MSSLGEILLVDDTLENLHVLGDLLRQHSLKVRVAASGAMALKSVQVRKPDLILLDIEIPVMDGFETCRQLRQDPACSAIPILFLSASNDPEDRLISFRVGGADFISKPFHAEEVLARVTTHLALARTRRDLDLVNERLAEQLMAEGYLRGNAEQIAAERATSLELTMTAAHMGAWEIDPMGITLYLDARACTVLDLPSDVPVLWHDFLRLVTGAGHPSPAENWLQAYHQQRSFEAECWWNPPAERERRRIRLRGRPLPKTADGGALMIGVVWDVSEEYRMRERVTEGERKEALGLLAGGVAHDFNNQLAVMLGEVEILQLSEAMAGTQRARLDAIAKAVDDSTALIRDLLTFARRRDCQRMAINVVELVATSARLAARSLGPDIQCEIELPPEPMWVSADRGQLENIMLTLCIRTRDLMRDGGILRLGLREAVVHNAVCVATGTTFSGTFAVLQVGSSVASVTDSQREHLFEPFFRSPGHRRNGLDLAAVLGCVASHDGHLTLEQGSAGGITFGILLPLCSPGIVRELSVTTVDKGPSRAPRRLLLLDDQATVREVIAEGLTRLGWEVTSFAAADAAIAAWTNTMPRFSVALVDMVMPVMSGAKVFRLLRAGDPAAKVVLMSGHTGGENLTALRQEGLAGFIDKPINLRHLAQLLGTIMEDVRS